MNNQLNEVLELKVEWKRGKVGSKEKDIDVKIVSPGNYIEVFKVDSKWGLFSNMAYENEYGKLNDLKVTFDGKEYRFSVSESLYTCLRLVEGEEKFISELGILKGKGSKVGYKDYRSKGLLNGMLDSDFDSKMVDFMRWILRVKLFYNEKVFGGLLKESVGKDIVEVCNRYDERSKIWGCGLWGSKTENRNNIRGRNYLGKLLMELRDEYELNGWVMNKVDSSNISLCNKKVDDLIK